MANWILYEKRLKINGNTTRDRQINLVKNAIVNNFKTLPSYRSAYFNNSTEVTDIQIIEDDEYYIKTILMNPTGNLNTGDIIVFDNNTWLCTEVDKTNLVYQFGEVNLCTQTLNLYKNHILYEIPCVVESQTRLFQLGTEDNKYLETPSTTIVARVPNTETTRQISRDNIYTLGINSYKIVDINDIIEPGLLILKMEYSLEVPITHTYVLSILNGESLQINIIQSLTLNCQLTDNGELVPFPALSFASSNDEIATISSGGVVTPTTTGSVVFTVSMASDSDVKDTIEITIVAEEQNNYTYSIVGDSSIIKGYSKTFTAYKYNNGVVVEGAEFTFEVVNGTTPTSAYTLTTIDTTSCSILANSSGYSITLRATDSNNGEHIDKIISLKNLF